MLIVCQLLKQLSLILLLTEAVTAFSWEPGGSKFAIIHGESPRISASFYNMEEKGKVTLLSEYYMGAFFFSDLIRMLVTQ